jgi:ADP-heptose:LPS heptosyltransferase
MGEPAATVDSLHGGPPTDSLFETRELYAYYANTVAPVGIYPEFTVDANILRSVRETLAKRVEAFGKHAVIALHCRQRSNFPQKNPFAADMARLARRLKEHRFGLVLFPDREGPLPEMQDLCDYECPLDPSFQEPASILKLCGAFIGGDSGPGHLAAAVGTPVLTLRPPRSPWVNGPFCASAKLAFVEGNVIEDGGRQALSFDVEAAVRSLFLLLDSRFS